MNSVMPVKSYAHIHSILDIPNLIEIQKDSFKRLKEVKLANLFTEISPIESHRLNLIPKG
jgi:DNA-directed RNA polymerase subunit beta